MPPILRLGTSFRHPMGCLEVPIDLTAGRPPASTKTRIFVMWSFTARIASAGTALAFGAGAAEALLRSGHRLP